MKKKTYIYIANWLLLFSIPIMLLTVDVKTDTIKSSVSVKNVTTNSFEKELEEDKNFEKTEVEEESVRTEQVEEKEETVEKEADDEISESVDVSKEVVPVEKEQVKEESQEVVDSDIVVKTSEEKTDVIETFSGNLSYYRANCSGCSGFTATGDDVRNGKLYYNDYQYGNVRIVAAGREIPSYSIVRIKNSSLGAEILAIVLDRGGNIGKDKKFLVDILTNSEEAKGGVDKNITVEVIRSGK